MSHLTRILALVGLIQLAGPPMVQAQVIPPLFARTAQEEADRALELQSVAERAKQTALQQMKQLGGQAARRASELQGLAPHVFLERLAVSPVAGPSTIAVPKKTPSKPTPSVNYTAGEGATTGHPGVALLLARRMGESEFTARCTGTLVRQNVVLTAAHCMCWSNDPDENFATAAACTTRIGNKAPSALASPSNWRVFFQYAGVREVTRVVVAEGYRFDDDMVRNDLALLVLSEQVRDIIPPPLPGSADPASPWDRGQIIGFGYTSTGAAGASVLSQLTRPGLKAKGRVAPSSCAGEQYLDPASSLCSLFEPDDGVTTATLCKGDSGGPLRLFDADGTTIGVASGRNNENCAATGTVAFQMATSYAAHRKWIEDNLKPFEVPSAAGRWPSFGESFSDVVDRRNSTQFDPSGAYFSDGWMERTSAKTVLATINSSGPINGFEVQNRQGKTLCSGQAGTAGHMGNVDYCTATVPAGVQFRIVAKGKPNEYLQYVVTEQVSN